MSSPGPADDAAVAGWVRGLGIPGLVDVHTHFLPERVMAFQLNIRGIGKHQGFVIKFGVQQ